MKSGKHAQMCWKDWNCLTLLDERWALAVLGAVFRYYQKGIFLQQYKYPKWALAGFLLYFYRPLGLKKVFKVSKHFWGPSKQLKAFQSKRAGRLPFFSFLVPRWAFTVPFYQIPQLSGKYWYHNTASAHCPIPQYRIPHDILTTSPTSVDLSQAFGMDLSLSTYVKFSLVQDFES